MAAPKRTQEQILSDRAMIAHLSMRERLTIRQIAARLGMTHQMVHYDLKAIRRQWQERTQETLDETIAEEIARLDALELELWAAWERSIGKRTETIKEVQEEGVRIPSPDGGERIMGTRRRTRARELISEGVGNVAFIRELHKISQDRRVLLGMEEKQQNVKIMVEREHAFANLDAPPPNIMAEPLALEGFIGPDAG